MRYFILAGFLAAFAAVPVATAEPSPVSASSTALDCAKPVSCRALQSCAQACGFLQQCGITKLDRDKDGIPCESLCTKPCDSPG